MLVQSVPSEQVLPLAHLVVQEPPQSTSASSRFLIPSVHEGPDEPSVKRDFVVSYLLQTPESQLLLVQSVFCEQVFSLAHLAEQLPPQSTSVSS